MKRQIKFGMAVAVLLLLSIGIAAAIPAIPADYSGNVTINGTTAPDGTKVFVQVNKTTGYVYQTNAVSVASGKYLNLMVNVESILEDTDLSMPVRFYIQKPGESKACLASPTTQFSSGPHTQDITLVLPPCTAPLTPSTGTPIPTPTPTATQSSGRTGSSGSSSSGSGSGGGGVVSAEPYSNVAKSEKKDGSLTANKSVLFSFTTPEFAIYQVAIMGKESENDVSVKVEHLKDTSKLVAKPAPGTVYANENVWASTKRIKEVVIRFRVKNAWITDSNVQKETIKLLRWDTDWKALDTTVLNSDNNFTYFESKSAGLSSFAVSAVKEGDLVSSNGTTPLSNVVTPPATNTSTPKKPTPGFGMLAAVLVVSAIYLLRRRDG